MTIFGPSTSHQNRASSRKSTLQTCKMRKSLDNIVLIDVDSDDFPNVIIIDVPEALEQKLRGSHQHTANSNFPLDSVISIEDDGSSDEECNATGEDLSVHHKRTPMNLSKCKRTYSAKFPSKNCNGLDFDPESGISGSDFPDCEFTRREQWESASLKRKYDSHIGQSGLEDQAYATSDAAAHEDVEAKNAHEQRPEGPVPSSSGTADPEEDYLSGCMGTNGCNLDGIFINPEMDCQSGLEDQAYATSDTATHENVEAKNAPEQCPEGPIPSGSGTADPEEDYLSGFMEAGGSNLDGIFIDPELGGREDLHFKSVGAAEFSCREDFVEDRAETSAEDAPFGCPDPQRCESDCVQREQSSQQANYSSGLEKADTNSPDKGLNFSEGPCFFNSVPDISVHFGYDKDNVQAKTKINLEAVSSMNKDDGLQQTPFGGLFSANQSKHEGSFVSKENSTFSDFSSPAQPINEVRVCCDSGFCSAKVETLHNKTFGCEIDRPCSEGKEGSLFEEPLSCENQCDKMQVEEETSHMVEKKTQLNNSMCNNHTEDTQSSPAADEPVLQSCALNEREKIKETDEYKKAVAEEWASRQQQLQIQAEEAQRLRRLLKRRRAESLRILDVERRQKLRVEEIRETKKKDEENMSLKEQFRVEVRRELNKLEMVCKDMASLLRGLGVHVGGGLFPSTNEVRAAYKRALLKLHPDRASKTDIRGQVEAEEKFKLISRMKEKLMPAS